MHPKIRYTFANHTINDGDYTTFLTAFNLRHIPDIAIKRYVGVLQIDFELTTMSSRPLYAMPAIRRNLRQLQKVWPYAPWCCDLETSFLVTLTLCLLDDLSIIDWEQPPKRYVLFSIDELMKLINCGAAQIRMTGTKAQMTDCEIIERQTAYSHYLVHSFKSLTD
jgi:hypothetical protein